MSWFFGKKQSKEAKERTTHKLWVVRESPDTNVDLVGCELYDLPTGLFSTCKVLRKEVLLFHTNNLVTLKGGGNVEDLLLVKVLDLHNNKLTSLPANIGAMSCLQNLNLEGNNLKELPRSLGTLDSLERLNVKSNRLVTLPSEIGDLTKLNTLDMRDNPRLTAVPKEMCKVRTLETLLLDEQMMSFPSKEIARSGLEAIMKFLCSVMEIPYIPSSHWTPAPIDKKETTVVEQMQQDEQQFLASLQKMEEMKEKKKKELMAVESQVVADKEMENRLVAMAIKKQQDSVAHVQRERQKSEEEQAVLQAKTQAARDQLLDVVKESERSTISVITKLLDHEGKAAMAVLSAIESQMQETETFVRRKQEDLDRQKRKEVLQAMEDMLKQSDKDKFLSDAYEASRQFALRQTQAAEAADKAHIETVLEQQQKTMKDLIKEIAIEEYAQMQAFQGLQLEKDIVYKNIMNQIAVVQAELTRLSLIEQKRKAANEELQQVILKDERWKLAELMATLLRDQEDREKELQKRLVELENQRREDEKDYWIFQYQRLMQSKPQLLTDEEYECDPVVQDILKTAGALQHFSFFARHKVTASNLTSMTDEDLRHIGVYQVGLRQSILACIQNYVSEEERAAAKAKAIEAGEIEEGYTPPEMPKGGVVGGPSAPVLDENGWEMVEAPTAPTFDELSNAPSAPLEPPGAVAQLATAEAECVVCLSERPNMILLNCGHVCSCEGCSVHLNQCPMCRQPVARRIKLFML